MNRPEPLTPEERELARLLGRAAPSAPSAALDEAVLAAARAAVQPTAARADDAPPAAALPRAGRRPRSRLPAALGLAASLVFAVGIAWQLKPESPPPMAPAAADEALDTAAAPPAPDSSERSAPARVAPGTAAVPPPAPAEAPAPARAPAQAPAPAPALAKAIPPPAPAAQVAASPAPPEPAPVLSARSQSYEAAAADTSTELDSVTVTSARVADARERADAAPVALAAPASPPAPASAPAAASRSASAPGVMGRAKSAPVSGALSSRALDAAVDADAALPRRQWLERIRERRDAGDVETARASLQRYLQQYPEVRVPRDLRPLLDP